ncbi:E3 ubiquitin-protein ligase TRIM35-like [Sebastes fasciatus]|uniref:E3 ubiquitin-protein ligase TRIM35-like n=1 Tax=Sebastes fasciatus TaxID=394691 RepID=UPI003D9E6659
MASWSEDLRCPVCRDIFKDPVLLTCSHTFCKACWQRWWPEKSTHQCPVCKTQSVLYDPPRNLALKNVCEAFSAGRVQRGSAALCGLHSEELKLFCLDHQEPVCVICLHSSSHTNHSFKPIAEVAMDYKEVLRVLLKRLQEKLELFNDIKGNFDRTAEDIEVQAKDTERQIDGEFSTLQKFLKKEQLTRIGAVREEKRLKSRVMKGKIEDLSVEIADLSDTVRATEEVLRAEDLSFLNNYKTAAQLADSFQVNDPQPIAGGLIDTAKHLNNLPFAILDSIKKMIPASEVLDPKTTPELLRCHPKNRDTSNDSSALRSTLQFTVIPPRRIETQGLNRTGYKPIIPPITAVLNRYSESRHYYDDDDLYG